MNWKDFITWRKTEDPKTARQLLEEDKTKATKKGEAWVAVLDTQVDPENIRNGFFELDWNNEFIEKLLDAGYQGETNEQIVEAWFRTVAQLIIDENNWDRT